MTSRGINESDFQIEVSYRFVFAPTHGG